MGVLNQDLRKDESALVLLDDKDNLCLLEAKVQALRALGNLCFDHDENRARVVQVSGVNALIVTMATFQSLGW